MKTYNVLTGVIDLVRAETPEEALDILERKLTDAGFDRYEGFRDLLPEGYQQVFDISDYLDGDETAGEGS